MQEKKKILFVITKGNFGGAQRYVYDLATHLPSAQFELVVACGTNDGDLLIQKLSEKNIRTIPIKSSEREINLKNDLKTTKELVRIILEEKPAIIHFNSSKISFLGSLAVLYFRILNLFRASDFGFRVLFTSHGWAFNEEKRSLLSKLIFYIAHYFTVLTCDTTIAVSEKTKGDIAWLPFIETKIKVIHNGVEKFKTLTKKEAAEILVKENKDQKIILTTGELHPNKGVDIALKGIALLPEKMKEKIIYYIAGAGEERETLEKLTTNLGLDNRVRFLGFVENAKKILPGVDIVLVPSRTENLPFAVLEPGIYGLPIIATSVGGISEIINDMQNGILTHPKSPKEIAEAVVYMLDHRDKQKEFGSEIKKTVASFFTLEKMLSETIKLYSV